MDSKISLEVDTQNKCKQTEMTLGHSSVLGLGTSSTELFQYY
jgi:hypothetical protein